MPKVNVYPPNATAADAVMRVEVGWRSGSDVQIATTTRTANGDAEPAWGGQWIDLDRNGVNHLIRALREARDRAYGRDE
jgi:hypothetical protein